MLIVLLCSLSAALVINLFSWEYLRKRLRHGNVFIMQNHLESSMLTVIWKIVIRLKKVMLVSKSFACKWPERWNKKTRNSYDIFLTDCIKCLSALNLRALSRHQTSGFRYQTLAYWHLKPDVWYLILERCLSGLQNRQERFWSTAGRPRRGGGQEARSNEHVACSVLNNS